LEVHPVGLVPLRRRRRRYHVATRAESRRDGLLLTMLIYLLVALFGLIWLTGG